MTLFGIQLFTGAGTVINALAVAIGGIIGMQLEIPFDS